MELFRSNLNREIATFTFHPHEGSCRTETVLGAGGDLNPQ